MSKPIKCPRCGHGMYCDVHVVSALWWTFGWTFGGSAKCPECGKTVRPKRMEYGTASGVMAALRSAAKREVAQ